MRSNGDGIGRLRRLDSPGDRCDPTPNCPAIFELGNGLVAVVGTDRTRDLRSLVAPFVKVASYEGIVVIPDATFATAAERFLF